VLVRTHRNSVPEVGTSGTSPSPSERTLATIARGGVLLPSAKERCTPRACSECAIAPIRARGAVTISPTTGRSVAMRVTARSPTIMPASALTSSVNIIHVPAAPSSSSWLNTAATRMRHAGIGRTRRSGASTSSAGLITAGNAAPAPAGCAAPAPEGFAAPAPAGCAAPAPCAAPCASPTPKLARTWRRSWTVSSARRTRSSAAIARVLTRAWPTGRP